MPSQTTRRRVAKDRAQGKSASTQAGEFVREEIEHIREGKHGARNAKQAIAIGLSKARRAGLRVEPGPNASTAVRRKAAQDSAHAGKKTSKRRARATLAALKHEPHVAASPDALSRHAKASAERRRKAGGKNSPKSVALRAAKTRKRKASPRSRASA